MAFEIEIEDSLGLRLLLVKKKQFVDVILQKLTCCDNLLSNNFDSQKMKVTVKVMASNPNPEIL